MIKKISHIIVSILLLIATTGLTIYEHQCGEELAAKSLQADHNDCCDMASACCHEEAETVQIDVEYLSASFDYSFELDAIKVPYLQGPLINNPETRTNSIALSYHSMPLLTSIEVRSYLQVFLL
ncbi:MAG: hypothetical protein DRJ13_16315 [Bacteroidetes bacterium]|nr:MAG: hypothetical protein DRJ13_16315 [Bacteroidota bacterium]